MLSQPKLIFISIGLILSAVAILATVPYIQRCVQARALSCPSASPDLTPPISYKPEDLDPNYWEYSPEKLTLAHQQAEHVLLYFWAPWCTTCASLDDELAHDQAQVPANVIVLQVKYDQAPELRRQYNVVTQHTFVEVDTQANGLNTWVGGDLANFDEYLN